MTCEVFRIKNNSKVDALEIQYTACSNGLSDGYKLPAGGSALICSYCHPYITMGDGTMELQQDHALVGIGAPDKSIL